MPEISRFFGIIITMYWEDVGRHNRLHFHEIYNEHPCVLSIPDLVLLSGSLPNRVMLLVKEWAQQHIDELEHNWQCVIEHKRLNKIDPLI